MPTYAYACTECDHHFEIVQSFTDDSLTECPQCRGPLRKLFSAVGVVFKGSGFYRTDSRSSGGRGGDGPRSSGSPGSGDPSSSSSTTSSDTSSAGASSGSGGSASTAASAGSSAASSSASSA